jgi:MOSC domain-containing protein YiiM
VAFLDSVNIGEPVPNPHKDTLSTGIHKRPRLGPVEVRAPGPKWFGLGSGLVGDFIGDGEHHGGDQQALYSFAREDLDVWQHRLGRGLPNGYFGENLTTCGLDVNEARLGERWRIGDEVVVQVTSPRIPCSTFRGWVGEKGWLKTFTADAKPGAYLSIVSGGRIQAGDQIEIAYQPHHDVTISMSFRALTTERVLLPRLLAAGDDLPDELRRAAKTAADGGADGPAAKPAAGGPAAKTPVT